MEVAFRMPSSCRDSGVETILERRLRIILGSFASALSELEVTWMGLRAGRIQVVLRGALGRGGVVKVLATEGHIERAIASAAHRLSRRLARELASDDAGVRLPPTAGPASTRPLRDSLTCAEAFKEF
jgi:hypothetical protein